jgi:hypothetical protein
MPRCAREERPASLRQARTAAINSHWASTCRRGRRRSRGSREGPAATGRSCQVAGVRFGAKRVVAQEGEGHRNRRKRPTHGKRREARRRATTADRRAGDPAGSDNTHLDRDRHRYRPIDGSTGTTSCRRRRDALRVRIQSLSRLSPVADIAKDLATLQEPKCWSMVPTHGSRRPSLKGAEVGSPSRAAEYRLENLVVAPMPLSARTTRSTNGVSSGHGTRR